MARDRIKANTGRCEGIKPYGSKEGEEYVLEKIKELYLDGKNSKQIAQQINAEKILSRYGKEWIAQSITKILVREGFIKQKRQARKIRLPFPQDLPSRTYIETDRGRCVGSGNDGRRRAAQNSS
jgi:hypothetical protein